MKQLFLIQTNNNDIIINNNGVKNATAVLLASNSDEAVKIFNENCPVHSNNLTVQLVSSSESKFVFCVQH